MDRTPISITKPDYDRLKALVDRQRVTSGGNEYSARLQAELDQAVIVEAAEIPADVVTMRSTVELTDLDSGETEVHTLVFPEEADVEQRRLSVLAPIGTAVLGYRVGDTFEWKVPSGMRRLKVTKILYQPEAAGNWDE